MIFNAMFFFSFLMLQSVLVSHTDGCTKKEIVLFDVMNALDWHNLILLKVK